MKSRYNDRVHYRDRSVQGVFSVVEMFPGAILFGRECVWNPLSCVNLKATMR